MTRFRNNDYALGSRLTSGPTKHRRKNWQFEKLEDRHMMTGDPVDPFELSYEELQSIGTAGIPVQYHEILPNDPYLPFQWHLLNYGQIVGDPVLQDIFGVPGEDANVFGAWGLGYTGQGVTVAVVDSGLQVDHPDLADNIHPTLGLDAIIGIDRLDFPTYGDTGSVFGTFEPDDIPGAANIFNELNAHGTAVAGLIGAVGNNGIGGAGVAYNSSLVPIRLIDGLISDQQVADVILYQNSEIDIYNHSWGTDDGARAADGPNGPLNPILLALNSSARLGRDGLGNIHVWAAGNDAGQPFASPNFLDLGFYDYAGYDGYINSPYTIGVTSVDHDGQIRNVDGTYTNFPEASASVLVAAPSSSAIQEIGNVAFVGSGILTTDFVNPSFPDDPIYDPLSLLYDPFAPIAEGYNAPTDQNGQESNDTFYDRFADQSYTSQFGGTSASAGIVSGVIALMLEANPNLSYRDVQNILVRASRQNASQGENPGGIGVFDNTWIVNQNEFFHVPDFQVAGAYRGNGTIDDLDLYDDSRGGIANDYTDSAIGSATTVTYNPILEPDSLGALIGGGGGVIIGGTGGIVQNNLADPNMFATGAGFTVSLGRGAFGTGIGWGHGVVDAELAVKIAEQYTDYLPDELTWTATKQQPASPFYSIAGVGFSGGGSLVVPGRFGGGNLAGTVAASYSEAPSFPAANDAGIGNDFDIIVVPESLTTDPSEGTNSNMVVEWVEVRLVTANGDLDETRVTLVSPDGTHSELVNYFDNVGGTEFGSQQDTASTLAGSPGGSTETADWTFTTNRHWGELSRNKLAIDPATGEPYANAEQRSWQLHIESFGDANQIIDFEVIFHGSPLEPGTRRIQGAVGVDDAQQDGYFNFERWIQTQQEIFNQSTVVIDPPEDNLFQNAVFNRLNIPRINAGNSATAFIDDPLLGPSTIPIASESLANGAIDFNRLGEVERFLDTTVEEFAENVTVQLFRQISDGAGGAVEEDLPFKTFITGDDGNYYFDVTPPVDESSALAGQVTAYVVRVVDGEGRDVVLEDLNAPTPADPLDPDAEFYLPHYKGEWTITADYFFAWDHNRAPEFVVDEATGEYDVRVVDQLGNDALVVPTVPGGNPQRLRALVSNLGQEGQTFTLINEDGDPVDAYDANGVPQLQTTDGRDAYILNWDPTPGGGDAQQLILLDLSNADPMMLNNAGLTVLNEDESYLYTLDDTGLITGTPTDPEANDPTLEIRIRPDGSQFVRSIPADMGDIEESEVNAILQIYDQGGDLVTVEQDEGGNYFFVSVNNIRNDVLFTPVLEANQLTNFGSNLYQFDPATDYDILTDADGTPLAWGTGVESDVRGINFLLSTPQLPVASGIAYIDVDSDGSYNALQGDILRVGATVYADLNDNGMYDIGAEPFSVTDSNGAYELDLTLLEPGYVKIAIEDQPGFVVASPGGEGVHLVNTADADLTNYSYDFTFAISSGSGGGGGGGGVVVPGSILGQIFSDVNQNGVKDAAEVGIAGVTVFLDADGNGLLDDGERRTQTMAGGVYDFANVLPGEYLVTVDASETLQQTSPLNDLNGDGDFDDPGERSIAVEVVDAGVVTNVTFGFFDRAGNDYGDLAGYGEASHRKFFGVHLGEFVDGELGTQSDPDALGDDNNPAAGPDDEDGVRLMAGDNLISDNETFGFEVTTAGIGYYLNAWIDWNGDGDFTDPGEHIYDDIDLNPGTWVAGQTLKQDGSIALPLITAPNVEEGEKLAARFRWGFGGLGSTGSATIGEVEDYLFDTSLTQAATVVGDYSGNGTIDEQDYTIWLNNYGATGPGLKADGNGDQVVDAMDYAIFRDAYHQQSLQGAAPRYGRSMTPTQDYLAYLNTIGVELIYTQAGQGKTAKLVPAFRLLQAAPTPEVAVADADSPAVASSFYAFADTGVAPRYAGVQTGVAESVSGGLSENASELRASQLDLALTLLDDDTVVEDDEIQTGFDGSEETEVEDQQAVAAAFEEAFA